MRKKYRDKENVSRLISLRSSLAVQLLDLSTTCLHLEVWCSVLLLDINANPKSNRVCILIQLKMKRGCYPDEKLKSKTPTFLGIDNFLKVRCDKLISAAMITLAMRGHKIEKVKVISLLCSSSI